MKTLVFKFCYVVGITQLLVWLHRKKTMILCYHGITKHPNRAPGDPDGLHARGDRFAAQLDYLQKQYHILSLSDYVAARQTKRALPNYSLVITFDDGWRNFLTVAAPILTARRVPVAMFLITDLMPDTNNTAVEWSPADDRQSLSWAEARALQQQLDLEIGSHTCSHSELQTLDRPEASRELYDSQQAIKAHLENITIPLAYPKGGYSTQVVELACQSGYSCGLTTERGFNDANTNLFTLRRQIVGDFDLPTFAAHVSGLVWWLDNIFSLVQPSRRRNAG